jgi:formate hydrogenlyase subunit 3/multisubunit Na+/H+ antiporter MnhD subunit
MIIIHMARSASAPERGRYYALVNLFFISCMIAMCADEVLLVLIAWETVALTTFMMSYSDKKESSRRNFLIITHFGGLMVVTAFLVMYTFAGTGVLSSWIDLNSSMGPMVSSAVIILLFLGFGTKLGLIPFHIWAPDLYANAPTHTTALLSTVSSTAAVLILFKSVFGYIGAMEGMYVLAVALLALSSVSALWGAVESLVQTEPKRILAYSSVENMALVTLSFALAILFMSSGSTALATIAAVAGLFHALNHSVFKSLMLLMVGTVEDCTGENRMDRMGGLAKVLPLFSVISIIAVLSIAGLPPFNGFASEWMMIQSFLNGEISGIRGLEMILPLGVAVLGVSGMIAAVSYARMYGFIFLGRPRSEPFSKPGKVPAAAMVPMSVLAGTCIFLGILAVPLMNVLVNGTGGIMRLGPSEYLDELTRTLDLPMLAGILSVLIASMYVLNRRFKKKAATAETWGCGTELEENMQYSSVGFTQPLVRVFHPLYGDSIEIVEDEEKDSKEFKQRFKEPFIHYLYRPLISSVMAVSGFIGKMQNGNIQAYLGYMLAVLVLLLLAVGFL